MSGEFSGHVARKRFGQNFLRDSQVIGRIVQLIAPRPGEALVEIGPGQGALTWPLLAAAGTLTAIELDRDLAAGLRALADRRQLALELIEADALTVDLSTLAARRGQLLRVVGNFPYNISSPLVFHLLDHLAAWRDVHCMLQKEVVERMAAVPGSKVFGRLSVMVQARCRVHSVLDVPASAFQPVPQVESAIARLEPLATQPSLSELVALDRLVRAAFAQRRKTLSNALRGVATGAQLDAAGISAGWRAEQVGVAAWLRLACTQADANG